MGGKLVLIDGHSILNRAFFGIPDLTNSEGLHTNAVYGFLNIMFKILEEEQPDYLTVAFDVSEPTFRHKMFAAYKGTRKPMAEELRQQVPLMKEMLKAMGITVVEKGGYEADDILGTIAKQSEAKGLTVSVVSGDRDLLQLATDRIKIRIPKTKRTGTEIEDYNTKEVIEKYQVTPIEFIDVKALMGDTSDNIPGVPGVGEKTAMDLIQKYGSVDAIYEKLPDIDAKPAAIKKLTAGEDAARHSYWLATIDTDAPLSFDPAENRVQEPTPAAYPLFLKLEFSKLIEKMGLRPAETAPADAAPDVTVTAERITEESRAREVLELFRKADHVTVLALPDLSGVIADCDTGADTALSAEFFFERYTGDWNALLNALFAADIKKVSHNVKDLTRTLLENGLNAEGFIFDTALAAYLADATSGKYEIGQLFAAYFHTELVKPAYLDPDAFSLLGDVTAAEAAFHSYTSAVDALYGVLAPKLKELDLWDLYATAELPLCRVLAEMELAGCRVDKGALVSFGEMLSEKAAALEQDIYNMAGEEFNINSPKQLGEILFGKLGLPHGKKTKTGWSTNADVLEKLRYEAPIVGAVLEYRQYAKLKSTYAEGLLKAMDPDGRIRTRFQMTVTATGRLSSTEPNLQNIPTRTDLGSEIRRMFIPAEGCVLVDADYSQIELRLLAHISGDEAMRAAFTTGADIHTATAAQVFHVAPGDVTHEMRRRAKAVNFGIVYGISAFSLSQDIGVTVAEAKAYMEAYFATFPGVRKYMDDVVAKAKEQGYVETLFHRRRELPEIRSSNFNMRSFGERVALNMPIQGTAADIMKLAMVAVEKRLKKELPEAKLVLQVHDELIVECPEPQAAAAATLLEEEMEQVAHLSVPLTAEAHWGRNWLEAKG